MNDAVAGHVDGRDATRRLVSVALALLIAVATAAVWYWPNRIGFATALRSVATLDTANASVLSVPSLSYYAKALIRAQMGPPLFLLFLFGLWRIWRHVDVESTRLLLVWMATIYLIQTGVSHKAISNDIGLLVPATLIAAVGIASVARRRPLLIGVVAAFVSLQFAVLTLPAEVLGARVGTFGWTGVVTPYPRTEDWKIEGMLQGLRAGDRVGVVSDHMFVNGTTVQFCAMKDRRRVEISPCWRFRPEDPEVDLSAFDVVLAKSDREWIKPKADGCFKGPHGRVEYAALLGRLSDTARGHRLSRSLPLPDGSALLVFRRDTPSADSRIRITR